nr:hypothetical protein [uncultured Lichenicoccus sp.]
MELPFFLVPDVATVPARRASRRARLSAACMMSSVTAARAAGPSPASRASLGEQALQRHPRIADLAQLPDRQRRHPDAGGIAHVERAFRLQALERLAYRHRTGAEGLGEARMVSFWPGANRPLIRASGNWR